MAQAYFVGEGKVSHRGRMIETPKYLAEEAAGRFLRPTFGTAVDLEAGLILVSDKVVIESRAFRLLPLTSIAVGQLEYLRQHLEVMAVKLNTRRDSKLIAYSIERLLNGVGSQKVPLCFHLRDDLTGTVD